ncbi:hypothetical protein C0V82_16095 [Niveispirillum cyanobacteriorum]|uniref:Uncharacterized protein n=1 Tax=Niveispirillum cyanobacteriorum TaxID=1612173 RepID=A0A2K9NFP5_9PROT|nr:hypothetical protein C0V82_16095 [Niveispirillum cyanobacteriorum]
MVAVRRQTAVSPQTWVNAVVPACVRQYGAAELVGGILQGDFEVIVAHSALAEAGFPVPPKDGDRVVRNPTIVDGEFVPGGGVTLTVKHPGDRGGAIGYWMQARGGGVG